MNSAARLCSTINSNGSSQLWVFFIMNYVPPYTVYHKI